MPELILSRKAEKELSDLTKKDRERVIKKLRLLREGPLSGKPLLGKLAGFRSLRVWPYRIIYEFEKPRRVAVHKILHRQEVYK